MMGRKHQAPSSKLHRTSKNQAAPTLVRRARYSWSLSIGVSLELGAWCLVLSQLITLLQKLHQTTRPARQQRLGREVETNFTGTSVQQRDLRRSAHDGVNFKKR